MSVYYFTDAWLRSLITSSVWELMNSLFHSGNWLACKNPPKSGWLDRTWMRNSLESISIAASSRLFILVMLVGGCYWWTSLLDVRTQERGCLFPWTRPPSAPGWHLLHSLILCSLYLTRELLPTTSSLFLFPLKPNHLCSLLPIENLIGARWF